MVQKLSDRGHDAVAASPRTGVNALTGDGLSPHECRCDCRRCEFALVRRRAGDGVFTKSTANLLVPAKAAGVGHYVAVSIVGADELPESGYLRAKVAQEELITESDLPYSIVRATQFAEFTDAIAATMTVGDEVRAPDALIQPIAADDLAAEVDRSPPARRWVVRTSVGQRRSRSSRWLARFLPETAKRRRWSSTQMLVISGHRCPRAVWLSPN